MIIADAIHTWYKNTKSNISNQTKAQNTFILIDYFIFYSMNFIQTHLWVNKNERKSQRRGQFTISRYRWPQSLTTIAMSNYCCINAGPASQAVDQHWNNTGSLVFAPVSKPVTPTIPRNDHPSKQGNYIQPIPDRRWRTVYDAGPTLSQHWVNVWYLLGYIWRLFRQPSSSQP